MEKKLSLYEIQNKAIKNKKAVYSIQQLANLVGKKKEIAKVYASRLIKKGLAKRINRGLISFDEDEFVIASQLNEPSYISFYTSLYLHHLVMQVPSKIECASTKRSKKNAEPEIVYHKIPPKLFFGFKKKSQSNSYILIAEPEKAIIDGILLNTLPKNLVQEINPKLNKEKLAEYVKRINFRGKKKLIRWLNC